MHFSTWPFLCSVNGKESSTLMSLSQGQRDKAHLSKNRRWAGNQAESLRGPEASVARVPQGVVPSVMQKKHC